SLAALGIVKKQSTQTNYRIRMFTRYGLPNSVISPTCFPATGSSRADSGLCHFIARLAISAMMFSRSWSEMSPGNGTASRPVLHTEEYDISESRKRVFHDYRQVHLH